MEGTRHTSITPLSPLLANRTYDKAASGAIAGFRSHAQVTRQKLGIILGTCSHILTQSVGLKIPGTFTRLKVMIISQEPNYSVGKFYQMKTKGTVFFFTFKILNMDAF